MSAREKQPPADRTPGAALPAYQIAIGDELLSGRTADTNSQLVQRGLADHGIYVHGIAVVRDELAAIVAALQATPADSLVVLSGGLGSTPDDLTRDAVARWAGVDLQRDPEVEAELRRLCAARGVDFGGRMARQAMVPVGLEPLTNPVGSAPGLCGALDDRMLVVLPGVPSELRSLLPIALARLVADRLLSPRRPSLLLRTAQIAEVDLVRICRPLRETHADLRWSWWLGRWGVDIGVSLPPAASDPEPLAAISSELKATLGLAVYATELRELNEVVQELMIDRGATLSVAESCTAGLLGARLTELDGASRFFRGGVLVYADEIKHEQLGVPREVLADHGAVSRETAGALAAGCRRRFATDYALAITGIAGPGGGSAEKPVGTTWICAASDRGEYARCYRFPGARTRNRTLAVSAALDTLRRLLVAPADASPWLTTDTWGRTA